MIVEKNNWYTWRISSVSEKSKLSSQIKFVIFTVSISSLICSWLFLTELTWLETLCEKLQTQLKFFLMKKYKFGYFDWETFLTQNVCYSASYHTPRVKWSKRKCFEMNIKIKIIPTKQKPFFKILLSNSYEAFDSKNCWTFFV